MLKMKRLIYFIVLMLSFVVVSCNHDVDYDYSQYVTDTYNAAFIKTFGKPADNQSWGFEGKTLPFGNVTRSAQPNSNQWGTTDDNGKYLNWPRPSDITDAEREAVLAVFNEKGAESYEPLIDIEDFFVQQVYCGPNGNKMNQLACVTDMTVKSWWPLEYQHTGTYTDDEINNFNQGKYSGNSEQGCMLMWFSSTKEWSFKTSQSGGERIYGHWRMEKINGNYYVGFDHEAWRQAPANANEEDKRDYIYNDWIIKIVPGIGDTEPIERYTVRIIAEDLSASTGTDFDFNDVVFDASYVDGVDKTYITLRAAGGTLPLFVTGKEVHELFGVSVTTMVNTGLHSEEPVNFEIDGIIAPWDIEVAVIKNNQLIPLKAETGNPAAKIAVDPDFQWCAEREDIRTRYPDFSKYVQDTTVNWY